MGRRFETFLDKFEKNHSDSHSLLHAWRLSTSAMYWISYCKTKACSRWVSFTLPGSPHFGPQNAITHSASHFTNMFLALPEIKFLGKCWDKCLLLRRKNNFTNSRKPYWWWMFRSTITTLAMQAETLNWNNNWGFAICKILNMLT